MKLGVEVVVEVEEGAAAAATFSSSSLVIEIGVAFCLAGRRKPFPLVPAEDPDEDDRVKTLSKRLLDPQSERAGAERAVGSGVIDDEFLGRGRTASVPLMLAERPLLARASSAARIESARMRVREIKLVLLLS